MTTLAISLTTALQDLSTLGRGRQYCWSGCSSDFRAEIVVASATNATTTVVAANIAGVDGVWSLPGDASVAGKYTLIVGSAGSVWVQDDDAGSLAVVLTTSLQDVSALTEGREVFLGGGTSGLVVAIEIASSTGASTFTEIARLTVKQQSVPLPNDSSIAMRYRVVEGTVGPNTQVWVCAASEAGSGASDALAFLTIAALEASPGPVNVSSAVVKQVEATYLWKPGATDATDSLTVLSSTGGAAGRWFLQGDVVTFRGQDPTNATGVAGDWALLNALMQLAAFKVSIALAPGTIRADTKEATPGGTVILGQPGTIVHSTLNPADAGIDNSPFFAAPGTIHASTLAADVVLGTNVFSVVKPFVVAVGDYFRSDELNVKVRVSIYRVVAVDSSGATTLVTVDRPINYLYLIGDPAENCSPMPRDIHLIGGGMKMSGTGARALSLVGAWASSASGIDVPDASGFTQSVFAFDDGAYASRFEDLYADGLGVTAAGLVLSSCESCVALRCIVPGMSVDGIQVLDSNDCQVLECRSTRTPQGAVVASRSVPEQGCARILFDGCNFDASTNGVAITDGSIDCVVTNTSAQNCTGSAFATSASTVDQRNTYFENCVARGSLVGVDIGPTAVGVTVRSLDGRGCGNAVRVQALASGLLLLEDIRANACTLEAISTNAPVTIRAVKADFAITARYSIAFNSGSSGSWIDGYDGDSTGAAGCIHVTAGVSVRVSNASGIIDPAGIGVLLDTGAGGALFIDKSKFSPSGAGANNGLVVGGATLRLGLDNNFDACNTPIFVNPAGWSSQGTVQLNGATPVVVPFPDLKASDRVRMNLQTAAGTVGHVPAIAYTPATGFSVTGVALDTSTWEYSVIS